MIFLSIFHTKFVQSKEARIDKEVTNEFITVHVLTCVHVRDDYCVRVNMEKCPGKVNSPLMRSAESEA